MRILVAAVAFAAMLAGVSRPAEACRCQPPAPAAESLAASDAVFVGEVVTVTEADSRGAGRVKVELAVERWFKGDGADRTEVITSASSAACGFPFEDGRRYLVYAATSRDGPLQVSLCSRTRPREQAGEDLVELERIVEGAEPETETETGTGTGTETGTETETETGTEPEANAPGDLAGRNSRKGRGCAAGAGAGAGGAVFSAVAIAAMRRRYSPGSKSRATELTQ